jgi:2'-5' RNA ligase
MSFLAISVPVELGGLLAEIPVPGRKEPMAKLHITLHYFGEAYADNKALKAAQIAFEVAGKFKPFRVSTSLISTFPGKEEVPVICKVNSPELHTFRAALSEAFDAAGVEYSKKYPEYIPHITLSYANETPADQTIPTVGFTVSEFSMWVGDRDDRQMQVTFPLNMTALKVAARYQRTVVAKKTENLLKFEDILKPIEKALSPASAAISYSYYRKKPEPDQLEKIAKELSSACRGALTDLKVEFEDPKLGERAKKFMTRFKNFLKMIQEWAKADTWAELKPVLEKQNTKSKTPYQKYLEYRDEMMGLIGYFDTEREGHLDVGGWDVSLWTSPRADWTEDTTSALLYVLREGTNTLKGIGMGAVAGGQVFAYPSKTLPGASGAHDALAAYQRGKNMMWIAAGGDSKRVLQSLIHESGHRAFWQVLSSNAQASWNEFFDANSGPPDVDTLIKEWESYSEKKNPKYGRFFSDFYTDLKSHDAEAAAWLEIIETKMNLTKDEERNRLTGIPIKGSKPALDVLIENRDKVRVFLHPVTAYSASSAGELFAEVFAHYALYGAGRIPEIVRDMFQRVLPQFKGASLSGV